MEKYYWNHRTVEIEEIEKNADGSKFVKKAAYLEGNCELLTDCELDEFQEWIDEELNGMWG